LRALVVAFAILAVAGPRAQAATTVGSSLRVRANLSIRCNTTCTEVQSARPGGAGLVVPADGVITRWRARAATLGTIRLRILRRESDGGYTSIAIADQVQLDRRHSPGQDVLYEFPARIAVQAGDTVGLDRSTTASAIFHSYGTQTAYAVAGYSPKLTNGAGDVQPDTNGTGRELLLNADVEKDVDGDGFGDETQDNCPTIPNDQTDKPCSTPTPAPTATPVGPTSTPVDNTNPQQHSRGSDGPPVQGEQPVIRGTRRHLRRRATRPSPPRASDPQNAHSRSPGARLRPPRSTGPDSTYHGTTPRARPKPPRPTGPDSTNHGASPSPRQQPVAHHKATGQHDGSPDPRRRPPSTKQQTGSVHDQSGSPRPAPPNKARKPTRRHQRKRTRAGPPAPQPAPGWQHH
jgi:hypothetical protein